MSILFKGNLEEGNYTLIKSTDGWVLKGETSYVGFNFADRKTENSSEKPNNSTISKMEQVEDEPQFDYCPRCGMRIFVDKPKDEPQTDCPKLINEVVKLDMSREDKFKVMELLERHCEKCKHYLFTDIDGYYCEHETYGQLCNYEPKDEPQKKEVEWVYNKRERLWYPYSNGELLFKTEPTISKMEQVDKDINVRSKDEQTDCTEALTLLWIKNMVTDEEFYRIDARLKVMPQTERSE